MSISRAKGLIRKNLQRNNTEKLDCCNFKIQYGNPEKESRSLVWRKNSAVPRVSGNPCSVGRAKQSSLEHCTFAAIEGNPQ